MSATEADRYAWQEPGTFEVAPGVHRIPVPLPQDGLRAINVYAIVEDDGLVLVDTGWRHPDTVAALRAGLATLGSDGSDIKRVLATHCHYDHYGLTAYIRENSGAEILLGRTEVESLEPAIHGSWALAREHRRKWMERHHAGALLDAMEAAEDQDNYESVRAESRWENPDRMLDDGEIIELQDHRIEAILCPGHTRGHIAYFDRDNGLLFAGDHVLPHITPSLGFEPFTDGQALGRFIASLNKVRDLPARLVLPGHGPVTDDLAGRVDELLAHHDKRLADSERAAAVPSSAVDVANQLTWTRREHAFADLDVFNQMLAAAETVTHLEYLLDTGRVTREVDADGRATYTAVTAGPPGT